MGGGEPVEGRSVAPRWRRCIGRRLLVERIIHHVELLERDSELHALASALTDVLGGRGRFVVVSGEAGIGKTALLQTFLEQHGWRARVLWGCCDALQTPRPRGPFLDIAHRVGGDFERAVLEGDRETTFTALLSEIEKEDVATTLVVEDVHWADEATLDLLRLLGRRLRPLRCLVIVSCRHEEMGPNHGLRSVIGALNVDDVCHIRLSPLSETAVATLAERTGRVAEDLFVITGGNPFYVTEVLSWDTEGIPITVSEAVLSRVFRLSEAARGVVELVGIAPSRVELPLLEALGVVPEAVDECLRSGLLVHEGGDIAFRHELARQAVEESIPPIQRRRLHQRVLAALSNLDEPAPASLARLAYHAEQAGEAAAVLAFATAAAEQAARLGAHREAAAHYQSTLRHADRLDARDRARLLERASYELLLNDRLDEALEKRRSALEIWRSVGDRLRVGDNLRWMSRLLWICGDGEQAKRHARQAVETLGRLPASRELATAYSNLSQLHMLAQERREAVAWGGKAIELARQLDVPETLAHALNNVGTAEWLAGNEEGRSQLEESLRIALELKLEEDAKRAYVNLGATAVSLRDYRRAMQYLDEAIEYCVMHDVQLCHSYLLGSRARIRFDQGDWTTALEEALAALDDPADPPLLKIPAQVVVARIRTRWGELGESTLLDQARDAAASSGELQWIAPVAAARAESAWLSGDLAAVCLEARPAYELALAREDAWAIGELGLWMWRAGEISASPSGAALPFALQIDGNWEAAAAAWDRIGCPYERAEALADGNTEFALRTALDIFERLGAKPAAAAVRRRMREQGIQGIPRGPRPSTVANPAWLTSREMEVLHLLVEGLRNAEIAERLYISPKTVEHHVSAVLTKLGVDSRAEVPVTALRMGIALFQDGGAATPT
jgi:DNA-binding CsgD family transcriptional regulator/tetratricopeptide (TPR) repeat protein